MAIYGTLQHVMIPIKPRSISGVVYTAATDLTLNMPECPRHKKENCSIFKQDSLQKTAYNGKDFEVILNNVYKENSTQGR